VARIRVSRPLVNRETPPELDAQASEGVAVVDPANSKNPSAFVRVAP